MTCGSEGCVLATLSREDYLHVTGKLEAVALAALRKDVPARPEKPEKGERTLENTKLIWGYLKELPFFAELRFPLLQKAVCRSLIFISFSAVACINVVCYGAF